MQRRNRLLPVLVKSYDYIRNKLVQYGEIVQEALDLLVYVLTLSYGHEVCMYVFVYICMYAGITTGG